MFLHNICFDLIAVLFPTQVNAKGKKKAWFLTLNRIVWNKDKIVSRDTRIKLLIYHFLED